MACFDQITTPFCLWLIEEQGISRSNNCYRRIDSKTTFLNFNERYTRSVRGCHRDDVTNRVSKIKRRESNLLGWLSCSAVVSLLRAYTEYSQL